MPVIKPALHHVTFKTSRLDEMIAWYGTVLGGTINFKDDHNAWMTNDGPIIDSLSCQCRASKMTLTRSSTT